MGEITRNSTNTLELQAKVTTIQTLNLKKMKKQKTKLNMNSNYLNKKICQQFSTLNYSKPIKIIDPYYISGLTQADGSFFCSIEKINKKDHPNSKGLTFTPIFDITLDLDSKFTLDQIQSYFGCGKVITKLSDNTVRYRVINRKDLVNIIIPHFKTYPVFFNKLHAFNLFSKILELLSPVLLPVVLPNKKQRSGERDLKRILTLSVSMNLASRRTDKDILELSQILGLSSNEPIKKIPYTICNITSEFNPGFLAGLIDGDGSFNISFPQNLETGKIKPVLSLCLGKNAASQFFKEIKIYLGASGVLSQSKSIFILKISYLDDLIKYVIPFIDNNPLLTKKKDHYEI